MTSFSALCKVAAKLKEYKLKLNSHNNFQRNPLPKPYKI